MLGDGHPENPAAQGGVILQLLHKYAASVSSALAGNSEDMSTSELVGGSRIHFILRDIFAKGLASLDPTSVLTDDDIRTAIQNSAGARCVLLIPEEPFLLLAKQCIAKMLDPCKRCASLVHEELMRLVRRCISPELQRYPTLISALEDQARAFLDEVRVESIGRQPRFTPTTAPPKISGRLSSGDDDCQPCALPASIHQYHRSQLRGRHCGDCAGARGDSANARA